jgi:hypothetical protein
MPQATAVPREARKGWAEEIVLPKPNCQRQIVAAVDTRKTSRKVFTINFTYMGYETSGRKIP